MEDLARKGLKRWKITRINTIHILSHTMCVSFECKEFVNIFYSYTIYIYICICLPYFCHLTYNVVRCLTALSHTTDVRILQIFLLYQGPMDTWTLPDNKVHGANMGPIWGRQDPGGPHVSPMNFAIWAVFHGNVTQQTLVKVYLVSSIYFNMEKCKFTIHFRT